jgi:tRNA threonylcarbamoyladenosine biosynthesis protein TsaB
MTLHILSLETSAARCGVALLRAQQGQETALWLRTHDGAREHSERLLPMVQELLDEAGIAVGALDAIAFGQGPGGFTGLRVACGVAQGLAFALDCPVLPVGTLAAVASQVPFAPGRLVVAALDARMDEAYVGVYRQQAPGDVRSIQAPVLLGAASLAPWIAACSADWYGSLAQPDHAHVVLAGNTVQAWPERAAEVAAYAWPELIDPDACAVARLALLAWARGEAVPADEAAPLYVRDKVAFTTAERVGGAGGNPRAGAVA